jgi:hypothetical protein
MKTISIALFNRNANSHITTESSSDIINLNNLDIKKIYVDVEDVQYQSIKTVIRRLDSSYLIFNNQSISVGNKSAVNKPNSDAPS